MRGTKLYCLRDKFPAPDDDEFYHSDLVGLKVVSTDGQALGKIEALHNFGASDLLEICDTPNLVGSWTLPFNLMNVPKVDIAAGKVVLADWQDYLPEEKQDKKSVKEND